MRGADDSVCGLSAATEPGPSLTEAAWPQWPESSAGTPTDSARCQRAGGGGGCRFTAVPGISGSSISRCWRRSYCCYCCLAGLLLRLGRRVLLQRAAEERLHRRARHPKGRRAAYAPTATPRTGNARPTLLQLQVAGA